MIKAISNNNNTIIYRYIKFPTIKGWINIFIDYVKLCVKARKLLKLKVKKIEW